MEQEKAQYRNPVKAVGFAQVEHVIALDDRISDGAYRLYALYIMYAQQKDSCFPGRETLAKQFKCSEATISRRNKELEDAGYITRQKRLGTSSITYLEDTQEIPYLVNVANLQLSNRIKNDTTIGSNLQPLKDQKCTPNNNKLKEQEEEKQVMLPVEADSEESGEWIPDKTQLDKRGIFVYNFVDNEYTEFDCCCSFTLDARHIKKTKLSCPKCATPIEVRDSHGKITHKPYIPPKKQKVLGDIIPDCPEKLACVPYQNRTQETKIKQMLAQNSGIVLDCLNWAINKYVSDGWSEKTVIDNAITAAGKRIAKNEQIVKSKVNESGGGLEPIIQYYMKETGANREQVVKMLERQTL